MLFRGEQDLIMDEDKAVRMKEKELGVASVVDRKVWDHSTGSAKTQYFKRRAKQNTTRKAGVKTEQVDLINQNILT